MSAKSRTKITMPRKTANWRIRFADQRFWSVRDVLLMVAASFEYGGFRICAVLLPDCLDKYTAFLACYKPGNAGDPPLAFPRPRLYGPQQKGPPLLTGMHTRMIMDTGRHALHPRLKPVMRVITVSRWMLFSTVVLLAVVFAVLYIIHPGRVLLIAAAITLPLMSVLFLVLDRLVMKTVIRRIHSTSTLMLSTQPEAMVMQPTGVSLMQGHIVELRKQDTAQDSPPWGLACITTSGQKYLGRKPREVLVYHDAADRESRLALDGGKQIFWGTLTTAEQREQGRRSLNRVLLLVLALLVGIGVLFYVQSTMRMETVRENLRLAEQSAHWPSVPGVVQSSGVEKRKVSRGRSKVTAYAAEVTYQYTVAGDTYTGSIIRFCYAPTRSLQTAREEAAQYPAGGSVTVAYDPAAPALGVLQPGYTDACQADAREIRVGGIAMTGMMILVIAIFAAIMWWQNKCYARTAARLARYGIRF
ncbi:DUF3592 domain-containing protein [Oceanidesulfovibrio marinus]|uniref:DUF3592 domain-containing protein n=2 Tax=Oceanidesulfovibrio marinus TaxID=370038 RepID=A0ABX6NBW6_9BACT|nr:DUF3592 domain-containing protein [Oceanidesulfovibrio marinus]